MNKLLIFSLFVFLLSTGTSCIKNIEPIDTPQAAVNQDSLDNVAISAYLTKKNWTAEKTTEGVYYIIDTQGPDTAKSPTVSNTVTIKYKGYLLTESVFDQNSNGFIAPLANLIKGFQIGIPKFKKGGKGKLLIPSSLGYGSNYVGSIPPNSPLVFEVELMDFK
jgi:FKBP-type peptidyl-prolyl cis-trans isomerase